MSSLVWGLGALVTGSAVSTATIATAVTAPDRPRIASRLSRLHLGQIRAKDVDEHDGGNDSANDDCKNLSHAGEHTQASGSAREGGKGVKIQTETLPTGFISAAATGLANHGHQFFIVAESLPRLMPFHTNDWDRARPTTPR
jgi:hypothetical protein